MLKIIIELLIIAIIFFIPYLIGRLAAKFGFNPLAADYSIEYYANGLIFIVMLIAIVFVFSLGYVIGDWIT